MEENVRQDDQEVEHWLKKYDIPEVHYANCQGDDDQGRNKDEQYNIFLAQLREHSLGQLQLRSFSGHSPPPVDVVHKYIPFSASIA